MPENHARYQERLSLLREEMSSRGVDGVIVPCTDEFQGEFLAPYAQRLAWLTGFTGSAGVAVVLRERAVVMSDGRYTIQLVQQVPGDLYSVADSTKTSVGAWLSEHAGAVSEIGYDPWLHTPKQIEALREALGGTDVRLVALAGNPVDAVWGDQPARPAAAVSVFPDDVAGRSSAEKRKMITARMREQGCAACVITAGDSICWLLNVRGGDVAYSPLVLSYAVLYADGALDWFVAADVVSSEVHRALGDQVRIYPFAEMEERVRDIDGTVWLDRGSVPAWFEGVLKDVYDSKDPCVQPKSIKTASEQEAIKKHIFRMGWRLCGF